MISQKARKYPQRHAGLDLASVYFQILLDSGFRLPVLTGAGTAGMTGIKLVATLSLLIKMNKQDMLSQL